jgi:hypothetical protein
LRALPRRALAAGASTAIALAALVTAATSASASSSWQLTDQYTSQPACYTTSGGTEDLEVNLNGSWAAPLTIGASGLPAGVSFTGTTIIDFYYYTGYYTTSWTTGTIPAGWSNGTGPVRVVPQPDPSLYTLDAEGYVNVAVPSGLAAGSSFNITVSASDGTTTQTETVPVDIKASCVRHY